MTSEGGDRKRRRRRRRAGMTLVEVLVGLAVSSIVVLAFLSLFATGQKHFFNQDARSTALEDMRMPAEWLRRDINLAIQVVNGPEVIDEVTYTSSETCLILLVPSIDQDGLIIDIETQFDYIVYTLDEEHPDWLKRIVDAKDGVSARTDGSRIVSMSVQNLLFEYLLWSGAGAPNPAATDAVHLTFDSSRAGLSKSYKQGFTTLIKLRNRPLPDL